jgi:CHASE2 domain-containing sensor protein
VVSKPHTCYSDSVGCNAFKRDSTMNFRHLILLLLLTTSACGTKSHQTTEATKLSEIILVNAGGQRCEVGEMINLISKHEPKAIGVNFLYIEEKHNNCDSILERAIIESGKVILIEGFENGKHVESNHRFLDPAMLSGLTGVSQDDNGIVDSYYRIIDHRGRWEYSFPFHLALQYDLTRDSELAAKSQPRDYPIVFHHSLDEFKVVDGLKVIRESNETFKNKIVIIGSMGQADDNIFITPVTRKSSVKTFGTLIIANVVLDILRDLDTEAVPTNKY